MKKIVRRQKDKELTKADIPDLFTRQEAAKKLRIGIRTLERLIVSNTIKTKRIGTRVFITPKEMDRYMNT